MRIINWNQTIKEGKVVIMKKKPRYDDYKNNYGSNWIGDYYNNLQVNTKTGRLEYKNIDKKKLIKKIIIPHVCISCGHEIKEGKKLAITRLNSSRMYAHPFCLYKSLKKKQDYYEKSVKNQFKEITEKFQKELLMGQLKENEN